jgi:hypothetical protein
MAANPNMPQTPAGYLKTTATVHFALIVGQSLFAVLSVFLSKKIMINVRNIHDPLLYVVPVFALSGSVLGNILFRNKVNNIYATDTLKSKLAAYQSAMIIRFALLEGPSLFAIGAFLLSGELFYLLVSVVLIGYFIYLKPTKERVENDVKLSYQELEDFNQPDKVMN